jgi:ferredoxin-NADP reductase
MAFEWKEAIIVNIIDETPTTKRFFFEVKDGSIFDFTPGQFITLDLPIHEKRNKRWRSYSIASYPNGTHQFELVIVLLEGGLGTTYLFNEVHEGSLLTLRGPVGKFTLPDTIDTNIYLISTGTGIAPFRSMAKFVLENNIPHKHIHFIFGRLDVHLIEPKKYQFALQARNKRGWGYSTNTWNVTVSKPGTRMATKEFHKIDINSDNDVIARLCPHQSKIMFSLMTAIYNGRFK